MIQEKVGKVSSGSLPGPKSAQTLEKRNRFVARGISTSVPICVKEAQGALIEDIDGNVFVDFTAAIGVQNVGHCDDEVVQAVSRQAKKYIHPCFHVAMYEPYINLAEKLAGLVPGSKPHKVMFANSGAEADENAIKISRRYSGKTGIISLENAFHGRTFMTMSITSKVKPYKNGFGPFSTDTYKIPSAYCYRCPYKCKYPDCGLACAERLRTLLQGEMSADNIACLIAEPVQGEGGFIVPPPGYLESLQSICHENDIVFIVDEVQAGFGRTGKLFASEHFAIEPDIITMSKSIAAGMPLSAVVGEAAIMDAANPGEIGGTYGGSPLACQASLKVIEKLARDGLLEKAQILGDYLMNRLLQMQDKYEVIGDVRGLGAMIGVEFIKSRPDKTVNADIVKKIVPYAASKGALFLSAGIFGNVLRLLPPLVMTLEQAEFGMDVLDEAIKTNL